MCDCAKIKKLLAFWMIMVDKVAVSTFTADHTSAAFVPIFIRIHGACISDRFARLSLHPSSINVSFHLESKCSHKVSDKELQKSVILDLRMRCMIAGKKFDLFTSTKCMLV